MDWKEVGYVTRNNEPRHYRGCIIWPKNVYGMYSALCFGEQVAADTLAGIKELIRERTTHRP